MQGVWAERRDVQIFPYGPKSRLIRAYLYVYTNKTVYDEILLSQSVPYCVSALPGPYAGPYCLSANQIKEFVPYFNQYTIMCGPYVFFLVFRLL